MLHELIAKRDTVSKIYWRPSNLPFVPGKSAGVYAVQHEYTEQAICSVKIRSETCLTGYWVTHCRIGGVRRLQSK